MAANSSASYRTFPIAEVVGIGMLLWALVPTNPYGYYIILRFGICGLSLYLAFRAHELEKAAWIWPFAVSAVVYNPLIRLHLTREIWSIVNIATIVLFAWAIIALRHKQKAKGPTQGGTDGPQAP